MPGLELDFLSHSQSSIKMAAVPGSVAAFSCLAVNVTGDGIPSLDKEGDFKDSADTSNCTYPGVISKFFSSGGGSAELVVPSGANRLIQVLGLSMPGTCPIGKNAYSESEKTSGETIYVVGSTKTDLFKDTSVGISSSYEAGVTEEFCAGSTTTTTVKPTDYNGLQLWLNAEDVAGNSGDSIATWPDASGNNYDATEASLKPSLDTTRINNKPALLFNGTDHHLDLDSNLYALLGSEDFTLIVVTEAVTMSGGQYGLFGASNGTANTNAYTTSGGDQWAYSKYDGNTRTVDSSTVAGTGSGSAIVYTVTYDDSPALTKIFINGAEKDSSSATDGLAFNPVHAVIGAKSVNGSITNHYNGYIAEVILYDHPITSEVQSDIECMLGTKYNIAVSGC
jgi:hypothetical protein